jgi:HEAT repeat protein
VSEDERARVELLSASRSTRRRAIGRVGGGAPGLFALRSTLLLDRDAGVRAVAAARLGALGDPRASSWLIDATSDASPLVRHEALSALALTGSAELLPSLERVVRSDEIWWVRRAAVLVASALGGVASSEALRLALGDPFWRVRKAAARSLSALGQLDLGEPEGGQAAQVLPRGTDALPRDGGLWDPDPAVVHDRLERQARGATPEADLVSLLADPHATLRELAAHRLAETGSVEALGAASLYLEEPRVPYAPAAARAALDRAGEAGTRLACLLLDGAAGCRALAWALGRLASAGLSDEADRIERLASHASPTVREAAIAALGWLGEAEPTRAAALDDEDVTVRSSAARSLVRSRSQHARHALAHAPLASLDHAARQALIWKAARERDRSRLEEGARDAHPWLRAAALAHLQRMGALAPEERALLLRDPDPWIRTSALDGAAALSLVDRDPDVEVRRAAMELLRGTHHAHSHAALSQAGAASASSLDPRLRARACGLLDPSGSDALGALLSLSTDAEPEVRLSACERLAGCPDRAARLVAFLADERDPALRKAAFSLLAQVEDSAARAALVAALTPGREQAAVREHVETLARWFLSETQRVPSALDAPEPRHQPPLRPDTQATPGAEATPDTPARPDTPASHASLRPLGRTGLLVSPLVLSGVHDLSRRALCEAEEAGVNTYFWEPDHVRLTSFLRGTSPGSAGRAVVVAGSFHASPERVERDLDQALRRLRRERIEVFLIFWSRSIARLSPGLLERLERLKQRGKIAAHGFSTHDRGLAVQALDLGSWDVVMTRHSAAHPGAEQQVFPRAIEAGAGVLGFSATCYGTLLEPGPPGDRADAPATPTAAECYRYSLSRPGVSACVAAPRSRSELLEDLAVLASPRLDERRASELRALGEGVRARNRDLGAALRASPNARSARELALSMLLRPRPPPPDRHGGAMLGEAGGSAALERWAGGDP